MTCCLNPACHNPPSLGDRTINFLLQLRYKIGSAEKPLSPD
ncbi:MULTISPECIES: hypothetical protein [Nostoc]|nr:MULTISPECIES: hypothetical protein [Nostoc]